MKRIGNWATKTLADVAGIGGGSGFPEIYQGQTQGVYPFIKVSDLNLEGNERRVIHATHWISTAVREKLRARIFQPGSIVFAKVGGALLTNKRRILTRETIIDNNMMALTPIAIDGGYLYQVLLTIDLGRYRQEGAVPSVNGARVGEIAIDVPPSIEQRKIADILGAWDEALEKLAALIAAKDRRKQALMQQLLTGKRWQRRTLGELIKPIIRLVEKPSAAYLAAGIRSHGRGVFLKPNFEPNDIALDELFQIRQDDLIVNITFAWEGAIAIVPSQADGALVSHRFPTFRVRESEAALSFLRHYILTKRFVFDCGLASPGGAGRNRVLSKTSFLNIELLVPSAAEQQKIGSILDTAAAELRLLRQQRATLDQQKRGLMQQLLTGRVRVKTN